jgi:predicted unusual protein kinase regulating ubiquinone biosynthesis (AarF/ABC1/UbiB family)
VSDLGGRARRAATLARLSAGSGGKLWRARRATARGDDASAARAHAEIADAVLEALGTMKGAAMKLGQLLAYVDLDLAPELGDVYRERLTALTDAAPPSDVGAIERVIAEDFGAPAQDVFAAWERQPIAVASIGQVHRARLHSGETVAVKVQHPGVAEAVEADLANVHTLARLARLVAPEVDAGPLVDELRERVVEELDYQHEASFQHAFAERYAGHPFVRIPAVHHEWCRPRVLVTEHIDGVPFGEVARRASQAERDRYGEIIFRFTFGSLYRFRIFNSDPHPGNFLFPADGTVAFLDFGSGRAFSTRDRERLDAVHRAVVDEDPEALLVSMRAAGLARADAVFDIATVLDWWRLLREPMLHDAPATYSADYARRVIMASADPDSPYKQALQRLSMPPEYLLLNRITFGLNSLLARLEPTANWHRIFAELSAHGDVPASPLGVEEAAFYAAARDERHSA